MEDKKVLLKPVEKDSLYLKISDSIYSFIKMNNLQPDDKLPSERDMAASLQTSRNSVREALRILENQGIIYVKTGSGVFVANPYGENSAISIRLTDCTLPELQELQKTLDRQAVLNALTRGTPQQKAELVSIGSKMVDLYSENTYSHTLDHRYHTLLYKMGKNNAIHQLINMIRDTRFVQRQEADYENNSIWLPTVPAHLDLAEALQREDTASAMAAIDTILEYGFSLPEQTPQ